MTFDPIITLIIHAKSQCLNIINNFFQLDVKFYFNLHV